MNWFISFLVALISGGIGLVLAGIISNACVTWYHIPNREGASAMFVIYYSLCGGLAACILGLILARLIAFRFGPSFSNELLGALGMILILAGITALLCRKLADIPPLLDGQELNLQVEFRFPDTFKGSQPPTAEDADWAFTLASVSGKTQRTFRVGTIQTTNARFENGQWIVPTEVPLFTQRGRRSVVLAPRFGDEANGFLLPLPPRPGKTFEEWSDWIPRQLPDGKPWPADKMSCRFRVQKVPLPEPPKSEQEQKAEIEERNEKEFLSIPSDAPLESWLIYLDYPQPQSERALNIIASRSNLAEELGQLALGENVQVAGKALRLIEKLPAPSSDFIAPVQNAGYDLIERIRKVNRTSAEEDPGYIAAADASIRFSGWMSAVRVLREKSGGDFIPELKTILELSRERSEIYAMRQDICRVASYYLHQWAGIPPLPSDPPPR